MQGVVSGWDFPESLRRGYATIGNFDGVHRGHQAMFNRLVTTARSVHAPAIVVTFDPPPLALLRPEALPPRLTTIEQRVELAHRAGVDAVWILPTTWDLLRLTAYEFFQRVVVDRLAARGLMEGPNFYFGRDRGGTIDVLQRFCDEHGIALDVLEPVLIDGEWVSSSAIRTALLNGELASALKQFGHSYRLSGQVVDGAHRGRTLGFPTANLAQVETVIPGHGVYAGRVDIDGQRYAAAINIGPNPTFEDGPAKIEIHLLDFSGDLYGRTIAVDLTQRVRAVRKFATIEELLTQIRQDVELVRKLADRADSADSA